MKKGSKVWRGLHPFLPSPLPPTSEWTDVNDSAAALSMLMDESDIPSSPLCPLTLSPSTQKTDPLTTPPQHTPIHPPSLTSVLKLNSCSMAHLRCGLAGSNPPDVSICHFPRWFLTEGGKKIHVSALTSWHLEPAVARPLGRYGLLKGH